MKLGTTALARVQQADGRLKTRPVLLLSLMPPFSDYLVCAQSSKLHHECPGFDEVIAVDEGCLAGKARNGCDDSGIGAPRRTWSGFRNPAAAPMLASLAPSRGTTIGPDGEEPEPAKIQPHTS
jgi:hypothetical protein